MKIYFWLGILVVATLTSQFAYSWGPQGHQTTALIAQQILQKQSQSDPAAAKALATIKTILGSITIDQAATWPDEVKKRSRSCSDKNGPFVKDPTFPQTDEFGETVVGKSSAICEAYKATAEWHFTTINTDKGQTQYAFPSTEVTDPKKPNELSPYAIADLVIIIKGLTHVLRSEPAPTLVGADSYATWKAQCLKRTDAGNNCKRQALEFLIHFLGDIHQPLHSGPHCDIGGNDQFIKFFGVLTPDPAADWCTPKDPPTCKFHELHQNWDSTMLVKNEAKVGADGKVHIPPDFSTRYSQNLVGKMKQTQSSSQQCMDAKPGDSIDGANMDEANGPNNGPISWANESACYFPQVYTFPDPDPAPAVQASKLKGKTTKRAVAQASSSSIPNLCDQSRRTKDGTTVDPEGKNFLPFPVGLQYYTTNMITVDERLYWGGSRLASLLKYIYGGGDRVMTVDLPADPPK
jgi:hypothetical protein